MYTYRNTITNWTPRVRKADDRTLCVRSEAGLRWARYGRRLVLAHETAAGRVERVADSRIRVEHEPREHATHRERRKEELDGRVPAISRHEAHSYEPERGIRHSYELQYGMHSYELGTRGL